MTNADSTQRSIFITAGQTPLGRALIQQLKAAGHSITAVTDSLAGAKALRADGALPVYADPANAAELKNALKLAAVDVVLNVEPLLPLMKLPYARADWDATADTLAGHTLALVQGAQQANVARFVHGSYAFLYADHDDTEEPIGEDGPTRNPDGVPLFTAALNAERAVLALPGGTVLRFGTIYGDQEELGKLEAAIKRGRPMVVGHADKLMNWVRVEDATRALLAAATQPTSGVLNVVDDQPVSVRTWLVNFAGQLGLREPLALPDFMTAQTLGRNQAAVLNTSVAALNERARQTLHWAPQWSRYTTSTDDLLLTRRAQPIT